VKPKASANFLAVSIEGFISSRSYLPMISPEIPESFPKSCCWCCVRARAPGSPTTIDIYYINESQPYGWFFL
jgi:hypothetical protein